MENTITYAGFWKRFLAYFIDQIILGFIRAVIFVPLWMFFFVGFFLEHNFGDNERFTSVVFQYYRNDEISIAAFSVLVMIIVVGFVLNVIGEWLYFSLMESSNKQATLGKLIVGIKVTDLGGGKISFGKATGRYFGKILSALILFIGFIMAGFTEKKQALHDILSSCLVVNKFNF